MSNLTPRLVQAAYHDHQGRQHWEETGETYTPTYREAAAAEGLTLMDPDALANWHAGGRLAGLPAGIGWGGRGPEDPCTCAGCTEPLD
jgi:hypothetical protein